MILPITANTLIGLYRAGLSTKITYYNDPTYYERAKMRDTSAYSRRHFRKIGLWVYPRIQGFFSRKLRNIKDYTKIVEFERTHQEGMISSFPKA